MKRVFRYDKEIAYACSMKGKAALVKVSECIITKRFDCPNKEINGKLCSSCKIPSNK